MREEHTKRRWHGVRENCDERRQTPRSPCCPLSNLELRTGSLDSMERTKSQYSCMGRLTARSGRQETGHGLV